MLAEKSASATKLWLSAPGNYRVEFPEIEGFAPIPDQFIAAKSEEGVTLDVQLERE